VGCSRESAIGSGSSQEAFTTTRAARLSCVDDEQGSAGSPREADRSRRDLRSLQDQGIARHTTAEQRLTVKRYGEKRVRSADFLASYTVCRRLIRQNGPPVLSHCVLNETDGSIACQGESDVLRLSIFSLGRVARDGDNRH